MGAKGIPLLDEAPARTGLPTIAEPVDGDDVRLLRDHVDGFLIGARSMRNGRLLKTVGRTKMPIVLGGP